MPCCAASACSTGMIGSFSPQTMSAGIFEARYRRSVALTRWPVGSMTARTGLHEGVASLVAGPATRSCAPSPRGRRRAAGRSCRAAPHDRGPQPEHALARDQRQDDLRPGQRGGAQQQVDLLAQAAARHEHEPLAQLRELVRELHRDAAAERVADDGRALELETHHQVADARGERAQRVVAARLGGLSVTEQVRRHHGVVLGEAQHRLVPLRGAACDAVDEDDRGPFAGDREVHAVTVQLHVDALDLGDRAQGRRLLLGGVWHCRKFTDQTVS